MAGGLQGEVAPAISGGQTAAIPSARSQGKNAHFPSNFSKIRSNTEALPIDFLYIADGFAY